MKVALLGDIHENLDYLDYAMRQAVLHGAELMIQVGDFGFDFKDGFISRLMEVVDSHEIQLMAIRGNHDDPWWWSTYRRMGNVHLVPDGFTTTIGKKRVAFLGGAVSIDRDFREEHIGWWKDERVNPQIVNSWLYDDVKADVLISHESPLLPNNLPGFKLPPDIIRDCDEDRHFVHMAAEILEPDVIYHGHYHMRYSRDLYLESKKALIEGLSCDGTPLNQSVIIVDW